MSRHWLADLRGRWRRARRSDARPGPSAAGVARIVIYGVALAGGTLALQWLDYQRLARTQAGDICIALIALGFLAGGIAIGAKVIGARVPATADGNPRACAALGISPRELAVLHAIAAGHSNKEIAARLGVSPNTVKTHVARLFEKLGARRRTDALVKARALGIMA